MRIIHLKEDEDLKQEIVQMGTKVKVDIMSDAIDTVYSILYHTEKKEPAKAVPFGGLFLENGVLFGEKGTKTVPIW